MIFLILGTQKFQLNRLLREMDELYKQGKIKERTFAQIGCSDYLPHNYDYIELKYAIESTLLSEFSL